MRRHINNSQLRSKIRQLQSQQRQAVQRYNNAVRTYNAQARQQVSKANAAINAYNRSVNQYNANVRANNSRLQLAMDRLSRRTVTVRYAEVHRSVRVLADSYDNLTLSDTDPYLVNLAEKETVNSANTLNALLQNGADNGERVPHSMDVDLAHVLSTISPDLSDRWNGALFSLNPRNPDAARHFCTSSREIIAGILESEAPDDRVLLWDPDCPLTERGTPTRRIKLRYLLDRQAIGHIALEDFAESDIDDVVALFGVLNAGAHWPAGEYSPSQLIAIKNRVEGAIGFVGRLARG